MHKRERKITMDKKQFNLILGFEVIKLKGGETKTDTSVNYIILKSSEIMLNLMYLEPPLYFILLLDDIAP